MSVTDRILSPYCLALTGGIACGKSTVGDLLAARGLARVDSDLIARAVVEPGTPALASIVVEFGSSVLTSDGRLDRASLGKIVFGQESARRRLEAILHPLIWEVMEREMRRAQSELRETVFEIPLLFEKGNQGRFSTIWVVTVSEELQLARLQQRDRLTLEHAKARIAAQMSLEEKSKLADFVITNMGDLQELEAAVDHGLRLWRGGREEP